MRFKEILLIDDNKVDCYVNQFIVKNAKIAETITVKSMPLEALKYLKSLEGDFPELIFLDIKMPDMDGFGFLEEFSKFSDNQKSNTKIVMLTSSHSPVDIERANKNTYIKHYLIKPLDADKLKETLKQVFLVNI